MKYLLRMTGRQHERIVRHVLPADGREAAALLLCGRGRDGDTHLLAVQEVFEIPHEACAVRRSDLLVWPTSYMLPVLERAMREHCAVVKVHGHPGGLRGFSRTDDASDRELLASMHGCRSRSGRVNACFRRHFRASRDSGCAPFQGRGCW